MERHRQRQGLPRLRRPTGRRAGPAAGREEPPGPAAAPAPLQLAPPGGAAPHRLGAAGAAARNARRGLREPRPRATPLSSLPAHSASRRPRRATSSARPYSAGREAAAGRPSPAGPPPRFGARRGRPTTGLADGACLGPAAGGSGCMCKPRPRAVRGPAVRFL